jgi:hypothetical protein
MNVSTVTCVQALTQSYNLAVINFTVVMDQNASLSDERYTYGEWFPFSAEPGSTPVIIPPLSNPGENMNADSILYCLIDFVEPQCGITVRWLPSMVVTLTLILKAIVTATFVRRSKHFRNRLYNSLGDIIDLAVRYPKFAMAKSDQYTVINWRIKAIRTRSSLFKIFGFGGYLVYIYFLGGLAILIYVWVYNVQWSAVGVSAALANGGFTDLSTKWSPLQWVNFSAVELFQAITAANSLQLWISSACILVDNHVTRMWQELDWHRYYRKSRRPRTSFPGVPGTKSARKLQLPYIVAAFSMALQFLLHWTASRAVSIIETTGPIVYPDSASIAPSVLGYNGSWGLLGSLGLFVQVLPVPLLVLACLWCLIVIILTLIYIFPFRRWMPTMAGSARVVFEACSGLKGGLPQGGIRWGQISDCEEEPGRAGFSSAPRPIVQGKKYWETQLVRRP